MGLTPEVMNALVRLMSGEIEDEELTEDVALTILAICADNRMAQWKASTYLNDHGKTFAQIVAMLREQKGVSVHEATVARWAKRPDVDRRRRRGDASEP
jgi:hypothetical protein